MCEKCKGCTGFDPGSATTITSKTKCARPKCKHKQKHHKEASVKSVVSLWQTKARTDIAVAETNRGLKSKPPGSSTEGRATRSGKRKKAAPTRKTFGVGSIQLSPNGILDGNLRQTKAQQCTEPGMKTLPAPDGITFNDLVTAGLAVIATDGNIQFYVDATEDEIDGALRDHFPLPFEYDTLRHPSATGRRWGLVTRANRRLSAVTASKVTGSTLKLYKGGQGKSPTEARLHFVLVDKIPSHIVSNLPAAIEALKRGEYVDSDSEADADDDADEDDDDDEAAPVPRRRSQRGKGKAKQQPESQSDSDSADSDSESDESGDEDKSEWKGTGSGNDNEDDTSSNANEIPQRDDDDDDAMDVPSPKPRGALKRSRSAERFMSSKRLHLDPSVIESDNDDCNSMSAGAGPSRIREQPHRAAAAPRVVPPSPRYRDLLPKVANPWKSV
ncbi:hypothetical protein HMN09_00366700 [Mycena chlorophos]|uniref:Uncharacterized protein n=1 Tax=Mycena chlorophos TaxID=658473 RepID=A0A8H6WN96_MYCCL|nr:hypothetical protein HMN09_00366700 [Mycena chlorophos]